MNKHYTKVRQEKTKKILERALNFLVTCHLPININNKLYKKINMSYSQVVDAMNHVSTKEEFVENLVWKDSSSVSYYKNEVNDAKIKRAELELNSNDFKFERKMTELELQLKIEQLIIINNNLKRNLSSLMSAVKEAELKVELNTKDKFIKEDINTLESTRLKSLIRITKKIIKELLEDKKMTITISETNNLVESYSYTSKMKRKSITICSKEELDLLLETVNTKELL